MLKSLTSISLLVALIIVNFLSYTMFTRFDFTEGNVYTLSDSTENILQELPEELKIKVFLSKKLPPQIMKTKQSLQDYLSEYEALADGNLVLSYIDPAEDDEAKTLAQYLQIPELQLNVIEKDQQQVLNAYMGLAVLKEKKEELTEEEKSNPLASYEDYEVMPFIQSLNNFEYELTSAIKKLSMTEEKTVGFLTGHGEHQLKREVPAFLQGQIEQGEREDYELEEGLGHYSVTSVVLTEEHSQIENIDTLIVAGPKTAFADYEVQGIKEFVKNGGNALFLIDQIDITNGLVASKIEESFSSLLSEWGVAVNKALVKDASHNNASFNQGFITFSLPYPYWLKVRNLNKESAITSRISSFMLPWVSPLIVEEKDGVNIQVLASTSQQYALAEAEVLVDVTEEDETLDEKMDGVEVTQKLQDQPINLNPQQNFGITNEKKDPLPLALVAQKEGEGKVFIMGDSDFITFAQQTPENEVFFLNVVDAFTLGEELISIRSKSIIDRPLGNVSEGVKNIIKWGNIIVLPLLFVVFGLVRRSIRNAKKMV